MSLSIVSRGAGRYALTDRGEEIGSLRGRSLRVHGFATEEEAVEARHAGFVALLRWAEPRRRRVPDPLALSPTTFQPSTAGTVPDELTDVTGESGDSVVARLLRPDAAGGGYAIEFLLPPGLYSAIAVHAAWTVHRAIAAARATPQETLTARA